MRIPVLTYHAMQVAGNDYANNDHVALASDLLQIARRGFRIVTASEAVDALLSGRSFDGKPVVLTCDDGSDLDFFDFEHPSFGPQRSLFNVLAEFAASTPDCEPSITSFVVVSPSAREVLDRTCLMGTGFWTDRWWREGIASGRMHIGNHSWDHNHETLPDAGPDGASRGSFTVIDSEGRADFEIRRASEFLWSHAPNAGAALFAYPYGDYNDYLVEEYFPRHATSLRIRAAFTDDAEPLTRSSNRWKLPRYIFGRDWSDEAGLARILGEA